MSLPRLNCCRSKVSTSVGCACSLPLRQEKGRQLQNRVWIHKYRAYISSQFYTQVPPYRQRRESCNRIYNSAVCRCLKLRYGCCFVEGTLEDGGLLPFKKGELHRKTDEPICQIQLDHVKRLEKEKEATVWWTLKTQHPQMLDHMRTFCRSSLQSLTVRPILPPDFSSSRPWSWIPFRKTLSMPQNSPCLFHPGLSTVQNPENQSCSPKSSSGGQARR